MQYFRPHFQLSESARIHSVFDIFRLKPFKGDPNGANSTNWAAVLQTRTVSASSYILEVNLNLDPLQYRLNPRGTKMHLRG
jgi:hypothetical protein